MLDDYRRTARCLTTIVAQCPVLDDYHEQCSVLIADCLMPT
ncbi:hypothetical protein HMPREF3192_00465 [Atopobium deltae]|uniref:Uncharacterized protein n=1 Tax=Atopobium deltae TaxID=1393034 RepID=A0A133XVZ0_9ACTN|nr:hypothetical protein HMPREF3192_00465 [Atopobium deltae]